MFSFPAKTRPEDAAEALLERFGTNDLVKVWALVVVVHPKLKTMFFGEPRPAEFGDAQVKNVEEVLKSAKRCNGRLSVCADVDEVECATSNTDRYGRQSSKESTLLPTPATRSNSQHSTTSSSPIDEMVPHSSIRELFSTSLLNEMKSSSLLDSFCEEDPPVDSACAQEAILHGHEVLPCAMPCTISFSTAMCYAHDDEGQMEIEIVRLGNPKEKCSVQYKTEDGSAKAGVKYVHTCGTAIFEPGEMLKTITVAVIHGHIQDANPLTTEFYVVLHGAEFANLGQTFCRVCIKYHTSRHVAHELRAKSKEKSTQRCNLQVEKSYCCDLRPCLKSLGKVDPHKSAIDDLEPDNRLDYLESLKNQYRISGVQDLRADVLARDEQFWKDVEQSYMKWI